MTLAASPAPSRAPFDALAPLLLPEDLRLTPEQFALVCAANPEAVLELDADGRIISMTPTGSETSRRNNALLLQLNLAIRRSHPGWMVFDSSGGFRLPDGSVRSPDASVVRPERWQALTAEQRRGFAPLCPGSGGGAGQPRRRGAARGERPAPQDGQLPGQRRPAGLAVAARAAGGGDLARGRRTAPDPSASSRPRCWKVARTFPGCGWSWRRSGKAEVPIGQRAGQEAPWPLNPGSGGVHPSTASALVTRLMRGPQAATRASARRHPPSPAAGPSAAVAPCGAGVDIETGRTTSQDLPTLKDVGHGTTP